jgi:hypothetical protein
MSDSTPSALSVGVVTGGVRASREWSQAVLGVARRVAELRGDATSPLSVNIVYHIPGEVFTPDFEGVRTGRYSAKETLLLIQVAIPTEPPTGPRPDALAFVLEQLEAAVGLADEFARKRELIGNSERLDMLHELVRRVHDSLTS